MDTAVLHEVIARAFTVQTLLAFCVDHFPEIALHLSAEQTKGQLVDQLIEYCHQHELLPKLGGLLEQQDVVLLSTQKTATNARTSVSRTHPALPCLRQWYGWLMQQQARLNTMREFGGDRQQSQMWVKAATQFYDRIQPYRNRLVYNSRTRLPFDDLMQAQAALISFCPKLNTARASVALKSEAVAILTHCQVQTAALIELLSRAPRKRSSPKGYANRPRSRTADLLQSKESSTESHDIEPYKYDAFVSYSKTDTQWVNEWLLPFLEQAGIDVCLDERDFSLGVPHIVNREQAIHRSRHVLLVLTPEWINDSTNVFESLLIGTIDPTGREKRVIPIMLRSCQLPSRLAILTYADFTNPMDKDEQGKRLVQALLEGRKIDPTRKQSPQ